MLKLTQQQLVQIKNFLVGTAPSIEITTNSSPNPQLIEKFSLTWQIEASQINQNEWKYAIKRHHTPPQHIVTVLHDILEKVDKAIENIYTLKRLKNYISTEDLGIGSYSSLGLMLLMLTIYARHGISFIIHYELDNHLTGRQEYTTYLYVGIPKIFLSEMLSFSLTPIRGIFNYLHDCLPALPTLPSPHALWNSLPNRYDILRALKLKEKNENCSICYVTPSNTLLNCTHRFCLPCIIRWSEISNTCPLCRAVIEKYNPC